MKYSKFMKIDKIIVKTKETTYPILVGNGAISLLKSQVNKLCPNTKKIVILFDKNVPNIFKTKIKKLLKKYKIFIKDYTSSEELKKFSNVNILIEYLIKNKFNRNDLVIAVGGGIIGDFSGFVASIFKRGINFINVPTTLFSQYEIGFIIDSETDFKPAKCITASINLFSFKLVSKTFSISSRFLISPLTR